MAKSKFIYVQDGNNDALCWPISQFMGFQHAADTTLLMKFKPLTNDTADGDQVTLTIASNSEKAVIEAIIDAINDHYSSGMVVVADNVNQVYISSNVTDVSCQLDT
jgi:hypothetical protein